MDAPALEDPLVLAFEAARVDPSTFRHREHLYVGYCYLRALPLEEALARFMRHLRRLVDALGVPEKLHATLTWGWLVLLDGAMQRAPSLEFSALLDENPGLLDRDALLVHYDRAQLDSTAARRRFVLPERS